MKRLWYTLLYVQAWALASLAFAAPAGDITVVEGEKLQDILATAIAEASRQLGGGASFNDLASNPAFLTILFSLFGSVVTYFGTNGIKLTTMIKGRSTQLLAAALSILTAGVGGYFGISEAAGITGLEGAALGALSAAGAFLLALGKHEKERYKETGLRKPERKAIEAEIDSSVRDSPVTKLAVSGLKTLAAAHGIPPFVVDGLISTLPLEEAQAHIERMIAEERALSSDEMVSKAREYEEANPLTEEELEAAREKLAAREGPSPRQIPKVKPSRKTLPTEPAPKQTVVIPNPPPSEGGTL